MRKPTGEEKEEQLLHGGCEIMGEGGTRATSEWPEHAQGAQARLGAPCRQSENRCRRQRTAHNLTPK